MVDRMHLFLVEMEMDKSMTETEMQIPECIHEGKSENILEYH